MPPLPPVTIATLPVKSKSVAMMGLLAVPLPPITLHARGLTDGRVYRPVLALHYARMRTSPPCPRPHVRGRGTLSYLPRASTCDASVTVVSAVATATEPYSGQRRFQVSPNPSACSACTPHISNCTRMAQETVLSPCLVAR